MKAAGCCWYTERSCWRRICRGGRRFPCCNGGAIQRGRGLAALLRHLRRRLLWREGFPHEIGLFLGYPPEDVQGFLADPGGGRCKLCGHWKVYHDVEGARRAVRPVRLQPGGAVQPPAGGVTLSQLFGVRETPAA